MACWIDTESGVAALTLDEENREAYIGGRRCGLTSQEFTLLRALVQSANHTVSRQALLERAWGYQSAGDTRTVDMHIRRLRIKLQAPCIETIYRAGYRLAARGKAAGKRGRAAKPPRDT